MSRVQTPCLKRRDAFASITYGVLFAALAGFTAASLATKENML
jgi:hypothetical protein